MCTNEFEAVRPVPLSESRPQPRSRSLPYSDTNISAIMLYPTTNTCTFRLTYAAISTHTTSFHHIRRQSPDGTAKGTPQITPLSSSYYSRPRQPPTQTITKPGIHPYRSCMHDKGDAVQLRHPHLIKSHLGTSGAGSTPQVKVAVAVAREEGKLALKFYHVSSASN